jgi:hypothetical protein
MPELRVCAGVHGVNKLHVVPPRSPPDPPAGVVVFFLGDRIESFGVDPAVTRLQDPSLVAQLLAGKFPGLAVAVVTPSRSEAGCACYDHFFPKLTLTGEPLGYQGRTFKASEQLQSLLQAARLAPPPPQPCPPVTLIGFSKGGVVLNQVRCAFVGHPFRTYVPDCPLTS